MRFYWATVGDFDVAIDTRGGDWTLDEIRARDSEVPLNDYMTRTALTYFYNEACAQLQHSLTTDRYERDAA